MKKMKLLFIPFMGMLLAGCSGASAAKDSLDGGYVEGVPGGGSEGIPDVDPDAYVPSSDGEGYTLEGGKESGSGDEEPTEEQIKIEPGQLTCSALDDNKYYDYWKSLSVSNQEGKGIFQNYHDEFAFNTFHRLDLTIKNGNNITVSLNGENAVTKVDNFNKAYLFPSRDLERYSVTISYVDQAGTSKTIQKEVVNGDEIDLEAQKDISNNIEIMFVIDATGSMGDEMRYIQEEINDVISQVKKDNANANLTLAMMVYRDTGDQYVTRYSDFTTDYVKQQEFLSKQSANGGGDFEEAVEVAMKEAMEKQWSENSTKLLFHVADAPAHDNKVSSWNQSALLAAQKGIKIITVASSGIDKKTEYFFRSQSLLTAGQYVYLTNHSGIGGEHLDATVQEQLVVEYLNKCLIRLIDGYVTGEMAEPISYVQQQ